MSAAQTGTSTRVGFVGVGRMGSVMLKCVLQSGFHATLCDPAEQALAPFLSEFPTQVKVAQTPAEAARECEIIEVVVNTNEQALNACLGPEGVIAGAQPGSVLLIHSTLSHETLDQLADAAIARGVHLLDAMVSGARGHLSVPNLAVMVGGDAEAFARAKPVMDTYGGLVLHLGGSGAGLDAKLSINLLRYLCMVASMEATRLAERAGIADVLPQLVAHTEANRFVGDFARLRGMAAVPEENRRKDAVLAQKDLRAALARASEVGIALPSTENAVDLMHTLWGTTLE